MTTSKKSKRANATFDLHAERKTARMWSECYRAALVSPDRRYCVNPPTGEPQEPPTYLYADDLEAVVDHLLSLLERFAEHQTFDEPEIDIDLLLMNDELKAEKKLKEKRFTKQAILEQFIERHGHRFGVSSVRTYRRRMRNTRG